MRLADEVFWAELDEIDRRRRAVAADSSESSHDDAPEPNRFEQAIEAIQKLEAAEQKLADYREGRDRPWLVAALSRKAPKGRAANEEAAPATDARSLEELQKDAEQRVAKAWDSARVAATPSTGLGLTGLALSGGGIRSATFNLGVLQAFCKRGLFGRFDYLSTVSGGSFIGGMMSSLLSDPRVRVAADDFPLRHDRGQPESCEMRHLRSGTSYLAPAGVIDKLRIPALVLRGLLINLVLLLPYLIGAAMLTEVAYGSDLRRAYILLLDLDAKGPVPFWAYSISSYRPTFVMGGVLIVWSLAFPWFRRRFAMNWRRRDRVEHAFALFFLATLFVATINTLPSVMLAFRSRDFSLNFVAGGGLTTVITIGAPLLPLVLASGTPRFLNTWQTKAMMVLLGLIGPVILLLLYVQITSWRVFCVGDNVTMCPGWWLSSVQWLDTLADKRTLWRFQPIDGALALVAGLLFVYGWRVVDVNLTSLHGFYRDRLSRAFLFCRASNGATAPPTNDELRLSALAPAGSQAPYHLLNATLNLQASRALQARRADFFLFSKRFVGSSVTGYMPTAELERLDRRMDLASAVAVSGAALAPNMGTSTNRALVFIMTLLNMRTGYWLPNPLADRFKIRALRGVGPFYLLLELFGLVHEESAFVNVSDGGHVENIGLYELLRRRCRYVVVCDAEADDKLIFDGLAKVIRYARMDAGIDVDLKVDRLRKNAQDLSAAHYAIGRLRYKDGTEDGWLIYLKATLCADDSEDIRAYCAGSRQPNEPCFPHESTSRQFFEEGQFEAYRALGYHVADCVLTAGKFHQRMTMEDFVANLEQSH